MNKTGIGFDAHRLVAGRKLILGGVCFDHPLGLEGHSDADVLCHAIADALLGAVADGDIGDHFPDSDPQWKDANSLELLARVRERLEARRAKIINVDAVVLAEQPKIAPHRKAMCANLARALKIDPDCVSVKATTMEGLGTVGRKEGIAVMAVVAVEQG
ncbi:MAG: 2-C-methyl-D-erythritol 2,4-cyclodiphosphate synthase [Verrucomicrobia bacterium]|nr:2-C-methyl-D-erythritol 2,4-cyclodiphosphate synthase [Verrucomicrobiota bacterium]MBU4291034.1 2-C-methyl-D-erythritol 2,4-cyclodiphosphate synthase [Verrucomicrobiota bacterium]MBU4429348.1 2-C-methyl-D-erythritol 2,4-cyclodiphosphate synthase [Verrucomicrobiota bacterium]MBU4498325.1 2-C-methyl-D-erythritol 2,4-cyclodiphosphate synthase [Verrucomicrobiota bacterium]MCG2679430.1 2-C-methyl-D-erythritol 2,4-cyclodiphosphate synthase [Kiritimatiellia bacterium]